jgi:hypothetical protein
VLLSTLVSNVLLGVGLGSKLKDVASVAVWRADEGSAYDGFSGAGEVEESTGQDDAVASVDVPPADVRVEEGV